MFESSLGHSPAAEYRGGNTGRPPREGYKTIPQGSHHLLALTATLFKQDASDHRQAVWALLARYRSEDSGALERARSVCSAPDAPFSCPPIEEGAGPCQVRIPSESSGGIRRKLPGNLRGDGPGQRGRNRSPAGFPPALPGCWHQGLSAEKHHPARRRAPAASRTPTTCQPLRSESPGPKGRKDVTGP